MAEPGASLGIFKFSDQGTVTAAGTLTISFGPNHSQRWVVQQVSLKMPTAPPGSSAELQQFGRLVAPAFSAKKAALGGEPPVPLNGGETCEVVWSGCTPGDIGEVFVLYEKLAW